MAGEAKAAWCAEYAAANRIALSACWGYADSHYDLPFLAALGHPVAVNPNRRLRAVARSRQWPVVRFDKASGMRKTGRNRAGCRRRMVREDILMARPEAKLKELKPAEL